MHVKKPTVVVVGAGDTVVKHYYPRLKDHVERQDISLWVTDTDSRPYAVCCNCRNNNFSTRNGPVPRELLLCSPDDSKRLAKEWMHGSTSVEVPVNEESKHQCVRDGSIHEKPSMCREIDIIHRRDAFTYLQCNADVVFIETPPAMHCDSVREWMGRADTIIVDKPFADKPETIKQFMDEHAEHLNNRVWGFDHYWATAFPLQRHLSQLCIDIGGVSRIEFYMLESNPVEAYRYNLPGMIKDMGTHLFAVLALIGDINSIKVKAVRRAEYEGAFAYDSYGEDDRESFAAIKYSIESRWWKGIRQGVAYVGKGISDPDGKRLSIVGPRGKIEVSFGQGTCRAIRMKQEIIHENEKKWAAREIAFLPDGHSNMIEAALSNRYKEESLYDVDTAYAIAQHVATACKRGKKCPKESYQHPGGHLGPISLNDLKKELQLLPKGGW